MQDDLGWCVVHDGYDKIALVVEFDILIRFTDQTIMAKGTVERLVSQVTSCPTFGHINYQRHMLLLFHDFNFHRLLIIVV
jgi:hypothetical protein